MHLDISLHLTPDTPIRVERIHGSSGPFSIVRFGEILNGGVLIVRDDAKLAELRDALDAYLADQAKVAA